MASGEEPLSPSEINRLAALAKNGSPQEREDAWRKLEPVIIQCTLMVAWNLGLGEQEAEEYAGEACSRVFERFRHFQAGEKFIPWLREVLKNWIIDELRKKGRRREFLIATYRKKDENEEERGEPVLAELAVDPAPRVVDQVQWAIDLSRPFPETDLRTLEAKLRPKPRVLGLIIGGLWVNVPEERWRAWCAEVRPLCEHLSFDKLKKMHDPGTRLEYLRDALNLTEASLRMIWHRVLDVIRILRWTRDLLSNGDQRNDDT